MDVWMYGCMDGLGMRLVCILMRWDCLALYLFVLLLRVGSGVRVPTPDRVGFRVNGLKRV